MEDCWYFDLQGPKQDRWVWVCVAPDGSVKARCEHAFAYYLEALEDAKAHGFVGGPKFGRPIRA